MLLIDQTKKEGTKLAVNTRKKRDGQRRAEDGHADAAVVSSGAVAAEILCLTNAEYPLGST